MPPPSKRRSTSEQQEDRPSTPGKNVYAPIYVPERPPNRDDDDDIVFSDDDEDYDTSAAVQAAIRSITSSPYPPEDPSRDKEDYENDEPYNSPAAPVPVVGNMSNYDVAGKPFEGNEPSISTPPTSGPSPVKKTRFLPADCIKREREIPEQNSSSTAGRHDAFPNTMQRPLPTPNPGPQPVYYRLSFHHNPEQRAFPTARQQCASPNHARMMPGRQSPCMRATVRPSVSQTMPIRMMIPPRASSHHTLPVPPEWMMNEPHDFHRPWTNRPNIMASACPPAVPLNDPSRIYRPTHSSLPRQEFITQNETGLSAAASAINSSPMWSDLVSHYGALPYANTGTTDGTFSPTGRFDTGSQNYQTAPPVMSTHEFSQSGHSHRLTRSSSGHQTGSNVAQLHTYSNPHRPSAQAVIHLNYSASSVRSPQNSGRSYRSIPISGPQPTLNVSNMVDLMMDSLTQMADALSNSFRQLPEGAYGFPPHAPGPNRDQNPN